METKTIMVDDKGCVIIPKEIAIRLGLKPREKLLIERRYNYIIVEKPRKILGQKITRLLKEGLKDVRWGDIEKEREDREW